MNTDQAKRRVIEQFGRNAEKYVTSQTHAKGADLDLIVEWAAPEESWVVLDIATGGGHTAKTLAPYVKQVFATDLTKEMLSHTSLHLKAYPQIFYVVADAESLPFLDGTFDMVTCRIAAHHFPHPEQFAKEASRVLKSNGLFFFIDNVSPNDEELALFINELERLRDPSHVSCLSTKQWGKLFLEEGLKEVRSMERKKRYPFQEWVKRTTKNLKEEEIVTEYLLDANEKIKKYYRLKMTEDQIESIEVDDWVALFRKG
ncbi:class I SAM-dependent methyltransferase [Bacillus safensis]|uniref:class I SAM-dependent methyltransferase n=1 Tax=Bacillus safensis TaxID=561879 RepID=UPI00203E7094|nr:class I SAM-dependent methyltransferase [Bacillus safensis]MCM3137211.1 class I SAM-dependent methyltransferase [Bacillus safensis]